MFIYIIRHDNIAALPYTMSNVEVTLNQQGVCFNKCWKDMIKQLIPISKILVQSKLLKYINIIEETNPRFLIDSIGPSMALKEEEVKAQDENLIFSSFADYFKLAKEAKTDLDEATMNDIVNIFRDRYNKFGVNDKTKFWETANMALLEYHMYDTNLKIFGVKK